MARYTGPVCKKCRAVSLKLMLKGERCVGAKCGVDRRGSPPGEHTVRKRRMSERGVQLKEKQRAKYSYGILERQFRKVFREALTRPGVTGDVLVELLERRLDNVIFRLGFASSKAEARMLITHGHITVKGKRTNIPSYRVDAGDEIAWTRQSIDTPVYKRIIEEIDSKIIPTWLSLDKEKMIGTVVNLPQRVNVETRFDEKAIVEYYSK